MTQATSPSPLLFFDTAFAVQRTFSLKAAVDLEVFTAIKEGHNTASALADRCKASERGLRMLVDYLVMLGFLTKSDDTYSLTQDSEIFLVKTSPAYFGGTLEFLLSPTLFEGFCDLTEAVRKGGTTLPAQGTIAKEHPEWVTFARAMMPMMIGPANWIAEHLVSTGGTVNKVLDVAAGHGLYGIEIAKRFPDAEVTAVDWSNVLTVARENADAASLGDRFKRLPAAPLTSIWVRGMTWSCSPTFCTTSGSRNVKTSSARCGPQWRQAAGSSPWSLSRMTIELVLHPLTLPHHVGYHPGG